MRRAAFLAMGASLCIAAPATAQEEAQSLRPARLPGMCVAMAGPGGEALSQACTGGADESFILPAADAGAIRIADKCLVPKGEGDAARLVATACDGSAEQAWTMSPKGELRSAAGRCLSLPGASSRPGVAIVAGACPSGEADLWRTGGVGPTHVIEASFESQARAGQCIGYDPAPGLFACSDAGRVTMSFDEKAAGQVRVAGACLSGGLAGALRLADCWDIPEETWTLRDDGRIANGNGDCIAIATENDRDILKTAACALAPDQQWRVHRSPGAAPPPPAAIAVVEPAAPVEPPAAATLAPAAVTTFAAADPAPLPPTDAPTDASVDAPAIVPVDPPAPQADTVPSPAEPAVAAPAIAPPAAPVLAPGAVTTFAAADPAAPPAPAVADPSPVANVSADVQAASVDPVDAPAIAVSAVDPAAAAVATPSPVIVPPAQGLMTLQHEQLPGMCVSLSGPAGESENRPCDGSAAQEFHLPGVDGGQIRQGDKCVASRGGGRYPQVVAETCNGMPEQFWFINPEGVVRSAAGSCLALLGASSRTGERVYAGECPTTLPAQHWRAVVVDPALVKPVTAMFELTARPGRCLGSDGALGLVECNQRLGRLFSLNAAAPSQLRLMNNCLASGYVFDGVTLGQCWDIPAQKWSLLPSGQLSSGEGKCIAVVTENGRDALRTAACQLVPEQVWTLKEAAP